MVAPELHGRNKRGQLAEPTVKTAANQALVPHSRPWITEEDRSAVAAALDSMMIAEGSLTRQLEAAAARYLGLTGGVATPDGTTALYVALLALEVGPGDEVVIPTYVCDAVAHAVRWTGATPVLCDVGDDWCANVHTVRAAVSGRTKAVVVVHTFGIVAETKAIVDLGVPVIEDMAQAFGASAPEGPAGAVGALAMTSFHATKCLTTGEGGMALTGDRSLLAKLEALKERAFRLPLSNLGAALGSSQLARYPDFLARRRHIAERYRSSVTPRFQPPAHTAARTMYFRFPLKIDRDVEATMHAFAARGVLAKRGVDALLHSDRGRFPGAEDAFSQTLSLPIHPSMTDDEVDRVIAACHVVLAE